MDAAAKHRFHPPAESIDIGVRQQTRVDQRRRLTGRHVDRPDAVVDPGDLDRVAEARRHTRQEDPVQPAFAEPAVDFGLHDFQRPIEDVGELTRTERGQGTVRLVGRSGNSPCMLQVEHPVQSPQQSMGRARGVETRTVAAPAGRGDPQPEHLLLGRLDSPPQQPVTGHAIHSGLVQDRLGVLEQFAVLFEQPADAALAARFLVSAGHEDQVPSARSFAVQEMEHRFQVRDAEALRIERATAPDPSAVQLTAERGAAPTLARGHDIDVVQQDQAAAGRLHRVRRQSRVEVRAPVGAHENPDLDLAPGIVPFDQRCQIASGRQLAAGRVARIEGQVGLKPGDRTGGGQPRRRDEQRGRRKPSPQPPRVRKPAGRPAHPVAHLDDPGRHRDVSPHPGSGSDGPSGPGAASSRSSTTRR